MINNDILILRLGFERQGMCNILHHILGPNDGPISTFSVLEVMQPFLEKFYRKQRLLNRPLHDKWRCGSAELLKTWVQIPTLLGKCLGLL